MSTILSSLCCCDAGFVICPTADQFALCQETVSPIVAATTQGWNNGVLVSIINWEWFYFVPWIKISALTAWILSAPQQIAGELHVFSDSGPGQPFDNTFTFGQFGSGADIGHDPHNLVCLNNTDWRLEFQWTTVGLHLILDQPINGCPGSSGFSPVLPILCPPPPDFTGPCLESISVTL